MTQKLLLLHGALGSQKQFTSLTEKLAASFEVYMLNFEGHGGISSENDYSIQLFTQNVIDFLDTNEIDEISIFGYSMGGYVALNAALQIPQKIKKIVTLGTKFQWDPESAAKEVKMLNPSKIEEKVPKFAEKLSKDHHPLDWKEVMTKTADMMLAMSAGAKLTDEDLKKVAVPVVIGIGDLDKMVSYEESENAASLIPNASLVKLEGVEHPIEKVSTEVLADYISQH